MISCLKTIKSGSWTSNQLLLLEEAVLLLILILEDGWTLARGAQVSGFPFHVSSKENTGRYFSVCQEQEVCCEA